MTRVLAPLGAKVRQREHERHIVAYLLLGVHPRTGSPRWQWVERMRQEHLKPVLGAWVQDGAIRDRAGAHRGRQLQHPPTGRVILPPSNPELKPAERDLRPIRREVEGRAYAPPAAKPAEVDAYLGEPAADPGRVGRPGAMFGLCIWRIVMRMVDIADDEFTFGMLSECFE